MNESVPFERWVVLLAGGIGSRFWPASTPSRPKQFLPLASARPLIVDTVERARALVPASNVLVVAGERLHAQLQRHLPFLEPGQLLLEPQARGTAPALAWAAQEILARARDPERTVMICLPSDHLIRPLDKFVSTLERSVDAAATLDRLLTIGVPPTRPETGYGYIEVGKVLRPQVFEVRRFIEKPDHARAEAFLSQGGFAWNSGMFVWRPSVLMAELAARTPELVEPLGLLAQGDVAGFFDAAPALTIDYGLMERSPNIAVVQAEFEWDDVGAWSALLRVHECDDEGNLVIGDAHIHDCHDSLVWAEDGAVVAFGLSDVVVVRASGITFVAPRDRAGDLKALLLSLPEELKRGID